MSAKQYFIQDYTKNKDVYKEFTVAPDPETAWAEAIRQDKFKIFLSIRNEEIMGDRDVRILCDDYHKHSNHYSWKVIEESRKLVGKNRKQMEENRKQIETANENTNDFIKFVCDYKTTLFTIMNKPITTPPKTEYLLIIKQQYGYAVVVEKKLNIVVNGQIIVHIKHAMPWRFGTNSATAIDLLTKYIINSLLLAATRRNSLPAI